MPRLTKKDYDGMLFWYRSKAGWAMKEIDKLGRYEDVDPRPNYLRKMKKEYLKYKEIEKELGIDLVTLFEALKNGIYGKVGNKIEHILAPHLSWYNREIYIFKLKDYGKTWALTREELE